MKILIVNTFYFPERVGGAEISVQHLAEELVRQGHQVVVVCLGSAAGTDFVSGVKVYRIRLWNLYFPFKKRAGFLSRLFWNIVDMYNPVMADRVEEIIAAESPDLIHTNILLGFSCSVWSVAHKKNIPVIHTVRDHSLICPRSTMYKNGSNCTKQCLSCKMFSITKKHLSSRVNHTVGISDYVLQRHLAAGYFANSGSSVIHNSFRPGESNRQPGQSSVIRLGYISRLAGEKGVELLIKAFLNLDNSIAAELIIAGNGEPRYVEQMKQLSNGANIRFLGFADRDAFYNAVDIVVVPSILNEALGRAILEAYAYGIPVIASRCGGIPEIVEEGKTGILFESESKSDLLWAIEYVIKEKWYNDKDVSAACRHKSREFAEESIASQYGRIFQIYEQN